jgi:hypothetical protein
MLLSWLRPHDHQRGQALLLVLVFVAAYLLLVWSALKLASGAFLSLSSVQADTMSTYALDNGLSYGLEYMRLNPTPCGPLVAPALVLPYAKPVTVNVTFTPNGICFPGFVVWYDVVVSATGTSRTIQAGLMQWAGGPWMVAYEAFQ